jgi:hypothetical protein
LEHGKVVGTHIIVFVNFQKDWLSLSRDSSTSLHCLILHVFCRYIIDLRGGWHRFS